MFIRGCLLLAATALAGCQTPAEQAAQQAVLDYRVGDYRAAQQLLQPIAKQTNENYALNNARLGSTVLAQYELSDAEAAFLNVYDVLNSVGVNNGGRTLGAVLVDEKIKIWKGEPFERAMANYYLGLVYYMQGDYQNARAAFENALFKLRDYGPDNDANAPVDADKYTEVDSSFILAQYMLARSFQRLHLDDLARANFARVTKLRPDLSALADWDRNATSNLLLAIDYGAGPFKATNGDGSFVGFAPTPADVGPPPVPTVSIDAQPDSQTYDTALPLVDTIALAQDRRWQSIDTIRTVKSVLGTGLIAGGVGTAMIGQRQEDAEIGLGLIAAGVLLKATSQADLRVWEMLPRSVYVVPLTLPPGTHTVTIDFPGRCRQTWTNLLVPPSGEATYYLRMQRGSDASYHWPPSTLNGWPSTQPAVTAPVAAAR